VNGLSLVAEAPSADHPIGDAFRLTVRMVARLQGFPDTWQFAGKKTAAYRQVGNAFPPPVAAAVGGAIRRALLRIGPLTTTGLPLFEEQRQSSRGSVRLYSE
jgi:DNA (cytosine-5)-methyltransferase 1